MCLNQLKYIFLNKKNSKIFYNLFWKIPFCWAIFEKYFKMNHTCKVEKNNVKLKYKFLNLKPIAN